MKRLILSVALSLGLPILCRAANDLEALKADMTFFTDASCAQLKAGVQLKDLDGFKSDLLKTVAAGMLNATYDKTYQAARYEAYPSPRALAKDLKLGDGFSRYENITGICLEPGEHVVFVGDTGGKELSLLIPDWMRKPADPSVVIKGDPCWGFSHETGHVLQMQPQMTWGGLTEVSCNIFSMFTVTGMGNPSRLKAQKNYASARKNIIEAQPRKSYLECPDVFDRLVPFWQLHLYFARHGKPDFYADVMEEMRRRPDAGRGNDSIRNQFEFVKICCDVAQLDLTDFFDQWGFFREGDITVKDYGNYHYQITQQMVDDAKSHIAKQKHPKPDVDVTLVED